MNLQEFCTTIEVSDWVNKASKHASEGYRLVHMSGTAFDEHFEVMVSYDKDYECINYRTTIPRDNPELPSISACFAAAFTYENELKDLFGFKIPGLSIDYGGNFLRTKTKLPFSGKVEFKKPTATPSGDS